MATGAQSPERLRFESYELDLRSGELWRQGNRVRLQEQPFQVLRLLLEHRGEVVTREELKQRLWPGNTIVDFDDGLNTAVKKIRELLGDSTERPRYIETIPRRGYRFIAPADEQSGPAPKAASRRRWVLSAAIALAVAIGFSAYWLHSRSLAASVRAIAVLPLQNLSGDPSQEYFAAGLTDALTTELARTLGSAVRVSSRISADQYRNKPLAQVARELDVDAVIEGSVVRAGNRARITAQLIHARADKHLWAASYDRDLHDILNLQREIAAAIARQVQIRVSPRMQARPAASAIDPQAYDLYQRGRYSAFSNNPRELANAIGFLERAVVIEPNLAAAHALLARAYTTQAFLVDPQAEELDAKAAEALNRALRLDPDLAEAYFARGISYWTHRKGFQHERTILDLKHAIELDPSFAEAHHWLGTVFNHIGLFDRAGQELRTALQLEPTNIGIRYRIAINQRRTGQAEEALAGLQATREFAPALATGGMADSLFDLGRKKEAAVLIQDYLRDNPQDRGGIGNAMQALLHADAGQPALAEQSIQAAIEKGKDFGHFHHAAYTIGRAYAVMNRPAEAVRWLRNAADDGLPSYPLFERDPSLERVRAHPNFVQFMGELKKRWERYREIS